MGLDTASNATQLVGAISGVYLAGCLIGSVLSSQVTDSLGRRKSLSLASALGVLGGALQAGASNIGMFIGARLIAGFGIGASTAGYKGRDPQTDRSPQGHCLG